MQEKNNFIKEHIEDIDKIGLEKINQVKLMNRKDSKYLVKESELVKIISTIKNNYYILSINSKEIMDYDTYYYDTKNFDMFTIHQNGKLNRHKIRYRKYVDSNDVFLEIKHKNNKLLTEKRRIKTEKINALFESKHNEFLQINSPYNESELEKKLKVTYSRMTLIDKKFSERVTIDLNLCFSSDKESISVPGLVIIELKSEGFDKTSHIYQALRNLKTFPSGLSKYCLGVACLFDDVKKNRMKKKIKFINKIATFKYN